MESIDISLSKEVAADTEEFTERTPASGKEVAIIEFYGSAAFSQNSFVGLVWKFDHATETEEILWSIKGEGRMPFQKVIPASDVDGVRKLALVLSNSETGPVVLSGFVKIQEK